MLVANDWATAQAGVDAPQAAGALFPMTKITEASVARKMKPRRCLRGGRGFETTDQPIGDEAGVT